MKNTVSESERIQETRNRLLRGQGRGRNRQFHESALLAEILKIGSENTLSTVSKIPGTEQKKDTMETRDINFLAFRPLGVMPCLLVVKWKIK
jgi:hypothetical protein